MGSSHGCPGENGAYRADPSGEPELLVITDAVVRDVRVPQSDPLQLGDVQRGPSVPHRGRRAELVGAEDVDAERVAVEQPEGRQPAERSRNQIRGVPLLRVFNCSEFDCWTTHRAAGCIPRKFRNVRVPTSG